MPSSPTGPPATLMSQRWNAMPFFPLIWSRRCSTRGSCEAAATAHVAASGSDITASHRISMSKTSRPCVPARRHTRWICASLRQLVRIKCAAQGPMRSGQALQ